MTMPGSLRETDPVAYWAKLREPYRFIVTWNQGDAVYSLLFKTESAARERMAQLRYERNVSHVHMSPR